MISFEVKHYFGRHNSYFDTITELRSMHMPMFDWIDENCSGDYETTAMDNAAFSDYNEDPWIGYYFTFEEESDAMAFKLRWM